MSQRSVGIIYKHHFEPAKEEAPSYGPRRGGLL
jgi:hypothetical protein